MGANSGKGETKAKDDLPEKKCAEKRKTDKKELDNLEDIEENMRKKEEQEDAERNKIKQKFENEQASSGENDGAFYCHPLTSIANCDVC